jgi:hypothetical protein
MFQIGNPFLRWFSLKITDVRDMVNETKLHHSHISKQNNHYHRRHRSRLNGMDFKLVKRIMMMTIKLCQGRELKM